MSAARHERLLDAALRAADRGWFVFPLVQGGKTPVLRLWEQRASTDRGQICRWWANDSRNNIGVAAGKSGLVIIDLDDGRGEAPPERFAGAGNGWEVLAMLAATANVEMPADTYTVATPGGWHLYFRSPAGMMLPSSVSRLGWKIDSRSRGAYAVGAASVGEQGSYRVVRDGPLADLPGWLATALTPASPPDPAPPLRLPRQRANAYVRAIVQSEADAVAAARTGTRHRTLLAAARTLGRLVGGGELSEDHAWAALQTAAAGHVGVDDFTIAEVQRTVSDGLAYGRMLPRRITASDQRL